MQRSAADSPTQLDAETVATQLSRGEYGLKASEYLNLRREVLMRWIAKEIGQDEYERQLAEINQLHELTNRAIEALSKLPAAQPITAQSMRASSVQPLPPGQQPSRQSTVQPLPPSPPSTRQSTVQPLPANASGERRLPPWAAKSGKASESQSMPAVGGEITPREITPRSSRGNDNRASSSGGMMASGVWRAPASFEPEEEERLQVGGNVFGYRLIQRLGADAFFVGEASDRSRVLIRLLNPPPPPPGMENQRVEALKAVKKLEHPGLIKIIKLEVHPRYGWLMVTEQPEGTTLRQFMTRYREEIGEPSIAKVADWLQPVAETLDFLNRSRVLSPVAEALEHLHRVGVIFHDVNPDSIFLYPDGSGAKVFPFSVSDAEDASKGRPPGAYVAPETWAGEPGDARTDEYSLACVAYEMLCGEPPFSGTNEELADYHTNWPVPPMARFSGLFNAVFWIDVPRRGDRFALSKVRTRRFPGCQVLLKAMRERESLAISEPGELAHHQKVTAACFVGEGKVFATSDAGREVGVWDSATQQAIRRLTLPNHRPTCLASSSDGGSLFIGTQEGEILHLDLASSEIVRSVAAHDGPIRAISLWPDRMIASAGDDRTVQLFTEADLESQGETDTGGAAVVSLCFSPYGVLAMGDMVGNVMVISLEQNAELARFKGHTKRVMTMCFSPDDSLIVTAGGDGSVQCFSIAEGRRVHMFIEGPEQAAARDDPAGDDSLAAWDMIPVLAVQVMPSGEHVVCISGDGSIRVFDMHTGQDAIDPMPNEARIAAACYLPATNTVVLGDDGGQIQLVPLPT